MEKVAAYQTELFWQTTAAELLGRLADPAMVKPLFMVLLDPQKVDLSGSAADGIMKIGKGAVPFLLQALNGQDADIVARARAGAGGNAQDAKPYVRWAATMLGGVGRDEALGPLMKALQTANSDVDRAVVARELAKLTPTPETLKAFQAAFDKVSPATLIPPGQSARTQLIEEAAHFYDPSLVPWLLKQAKATKGDVRMSALLSAIKLMTKVRMAEVKKAVDMVGTEIEKDAYRIAADVLNACGEKVDCYLAKVQDPTSQEEKTQFAGIKCGYMLALLGNPETGMEIARELPKIRNAAVRYAAVSAIDHLVRNDALPVADALQKVVDENKAKGDPSMIQADRSVKQVIYRLRAR
jgi:HEAT repeat protein